MLLGLLEFFFLALLLALEQLFVLLVQQHELDV